MERSLTLVPRPRRQARSVEVRREERKLFFWTARESLKLVLFAAFTASAVVAVVYALVVGRPDVLGVVARLLQR